MLRVRNDLLKSAVSVLHSFLLNWQVFVRIVFSICKGKGIDFIEGFSLRTSLIQDGEP